LQKPEEVGNLILEFLNKNHHSSHQISNSNFPMSK